MSEQSVTDTIARPLVAAIDAAIAAQQDVIRQLMRARAEVMRLVDETIDAYEPERDPIPYVDYLPDPDIWMTAENINDARPPMRGAR